MAPTPTREPTQTGLYSVLPALTVVTGLIDAVSYLGIGQECSSARSPEQRSSTAWASPPSSPRSQWCSRRSRTGT
jgi:hypothetical protein